MSPDSAAIKTTNFPESAIQISFFTLVCFTVFLGLAYPVSFLATAEIASKAFLQGVLC